MRTRSAKQLAQRIDLHYFKRPHALRRWRTVLSVALPLLGLAWLGGMAAAGNRAPYSGGPVSSAHAFAEMKCETCHVRDTSFRAHVPEAACLTCHDAPRHPPSPSATAGQVPSPSATAGHPPSPSATAGQVEPECATCHREHQGRISLARATPDAACVACHGTMPSAVAAATRRAGNAGSRVIASVSGFPAGHPESAVLREERRDPGTIRFNHEVHAKPDLRGPGGPETLACAGCHKPEIARVSSQRRLVTGLMAPVTYELQCARCHPLFFDERIDAAAPHEEPAAIRPFVRQALREYIASHPGDITKPDPAPRRVPLNFPRPQEPPARTAGEWVERKAWRAEDLLWNRTCTYCHTVRHVDGVPGPQYAIAPAAVTTRWMPAARFDHAPHLMIQCSSCHQAERSRDTADVLMPPLATCGTCHAPDRGASAACAECHGYHDWTKAQPVKPRFTLDDFK